MYIKGIANEKSKKLEVQIFKVIFNDVVVHKISKKI